MQKQKLTHINKRDGRKVKLDPNKITQAMLKAFLATQELATVQKAESEAKRLTPIAVQLFERTVNGQPPSVETMQDVVEQVLMAAGHYQTAKAYILYRAQQKEEREAKSVIGVEDDLGLSVNQLKVIERRYLRHDDEGRVLETPKAMFERVAHAVAVNEKDQPKWEKQFLEILTSFEFVPAGCYLRGAGTERQMLANCFVLPVEDSMEGIFDAVKWMAQVHQKGGGTGFNFSKLRPKGDYVMSSGGFSSGPISFMKVFDAATRQVMQGGFRRGANMGILNVDHPDILDFITCKTEEHEINNFNISVGATDEFMAAVEKDADFHLKNQRTGEIVQTISARTLFDQMITLAWRTGDPGMIYLDVINRANPVLETLGPMLATNPCIVGEALVSTSQGLKQMDTLDPSLQVITDQRVIEGAAEVKLGPVQAFYDQGEKAVWKLTTQAGFELMATPDHNIRTTQGWMHLKGLTPEHQVLLQPGEGRFNLDSVLPFSPTSKALPTEWSRELGQILGWLVGDGWLRTGDKNCRVGFVFSQQDHRIMAALKPMLNLWYGQDIEPVLRENNVWHLSYHAQFFVDFFKTLGVIARKASDKQVPVTLLTAPQEAVIGFLQGLFTADGMVGINAAKGNYYVRLTAKSQGLLHGVQLLLLNFGIKANLYDRKRPARRGFAYTSKSGQITDYELDGVLWELNLSKINAKRFMEIIGFLENKHQEKVTKLMAVRFKSESFVDPVAFVEPFGKAKVYDITEPTTHSFIANGIVVSNCGEQPLHPFDVCNLGSINLARFVKKNLEPRTWNLGKESQSSEFQVLSSVSKHINWSRLEEVTRLAVRFLDNGVDVSTYPIPQIKDMAQKNRRIGLGVMGWADLLYQLQVPYNSDLGFELAEKVMHFIYTVSHSESESLAEEKGTFKHWKGSRYEKQGMKQRNIALTTIAPTGTISMVAECSSGIEPIFALSYVKNVVDDQGLTYVNPYFERAMEEAVKDAIYRQELIDEVARTGSCQHIDGIPQAIKDIFVTAHDLTWEQHVRMQGAFQKWTDNAVSKTINFPHDASIEEIGQAYLLAWKLGCKGITIYRDGSKSFQILQNLKPKSEDFRPELGPKTRIPNDEINPKKEPVIQSKIKVKSLKERMREGRELEQVKSEKLKVKSGGTENDEIRMTNDETENTRLRDYATAGKANKMESLTPKPSTLNPESCPECGGKVQNTEGCMMCMECGYSKCSL